MPSPSFEIAHERFALVDRRIRVAHHGREVVRDGRLLTSFFHAYPQIGATVARTLVRGQAVYADGAFAARPLGRFLRPTA